MTLVCVLWVVAAILAVVNGTVGRVPLWVAVFLAALAGALGCLPLRW